MRNLMRLRALLVSGLMTVLALTAATCTADDAASPSETPGSQTTATAQATDTTAPSASPQATSTSTPPRTTGTVGTTPVSNPNQEFSPEEVVAAYEQTLIELYDRLVPSVVRIVALGTTSGEGSGWVWDQDGHIVTNYHVVQDADSLRVFFFDGSEYDAEVVGTDLDSDLAVIRIDAPADQLMPMNLGNSSDLQPGQLAIAMGNPFGQDFTMTTGIVSAIGRLIESGFSQFSIPEVIQTDAAINPGNSGGPLLDRHGNVIGINAQIRSQTRQSSGVGLAIPVDLAKRVVPSLIEDGTHEYSFLGISGQSLNKDIREELGLPEDLRGVIVSSVTQGGPADDAGIRGGQNLSGDVIVSVDGQEVSTMEALIAYLALHTSPGEQVVFEVYRDGETEPVTVTLGARPSR